MSKKAQYQGFKVTSVTDGTYWLFEPANINKARLLVDIGVKAREVEQHGRPRTSVKGNNTAICRDVVDLLSAMDKSQAERTATLAGCDDVNHLFMSATGRPDKGKRGNAMNEQQAAEKARTCYQAIQKASKKKLRDSAWKVGKIKHVQSLSDNDAKVLAERAEYFNNLLMDTMHADALKENARRDKAAQATAPATAPATDSKTA